MTTATTEEIAVGGRPEGMSMPLLGMVLFIASEVMFFGGLFAAYFNIRAQAPEWPPAGLEHLHASVPGFFTVLLLLSSVTMQMAVFAIRRGNVRALTRWTAVTIVLGVVFLCGQIYDYSTLDFTIRDGVYGSTFYTLTGFHGVHVSVGIIMLLAVVGMISRDRIPGDRAEVVELVGLYWHFVDIVWIVIFTLVYLIPA